MLVLGPIAFAAPWLLVAGVLLPVVWWLLRLTPPVARQVRFPALRLLRDLVAREETPAHTPRWLLVLRLLIAGGVILALSGPVLHPDGVLPGHGPLVLVIDNGWSVAGDWSARQALLSKVLARADRQGRRVVVATTAPEALPGAGEGQLRTPVAGPMPAGDARRLVMGLTPWPWPEDRAAALAALKGLGAGVGAGSPVLWLSSGLEDAGTGPLVEYLRRLGGGLEVALPDRLPDLLLPPLTEGEALAARLARAVPGPERTVAVRLSAGDGRLLAQENARFAASAATAAVRFDLPLDLRNQAMRLDLEGQASVGATVLLDERWRRRPVGLVAGRPTGETPPLLSDLFYLERALAPTSEVRRGNLADLLESDVSVLILPDHGALTDDEVRALGEWVGRGGLLVRFAGPRLARASDALLPVRLRQGDRVLGGALSWAKPAHLAPFEDDSPFAGLDVPADVTVGRQVLAEPTLDIAGHTWARLADGTPLVTADRRGQGTIVLVHTTASPDWSNLALSGLFVDMLRRLVALGAGVEEGPRAQGGSLAPLALLDGLGRLGEPPASSLPIPARAWPETRVGPEHPPGFYGTATLRRALNLTAGLTRLQPLGQLPAGVRAIGYAGTGERDLKPPLLAAVLVLLLADMVLALVMRGLLTRPWGPLRGAGRLFRGGLGLVLAVLLLGSQPVRADEGGDFAERATGKTWLAYVVTGDAAVDQVSRAGLEGLMPVLLRRTAVDVGGVAAVAIETDQLAFFPLLYWPVTPAQPALSEKARRRVNDYLHQGGTILFDTQDDQPEPVGTAGASRGPPLRTLTEGLDIPPLAPLPSDHVLTKSFYLLQEFPGRTSGGQVWVEASEERRLDGVSSVIVGGNDWAGAWAVDGQGRPQFAAVPGGERQREMAYRFGVNLVMYALTGNYKADQVHVPAILERIGR